MRVPDALTKAELERLPEAEELSPGLPAERPHCALWIPSLFTSSHSLLLDRMQVYLVALQGLLLRCGFDCTVCTPFQDPAPVFVSVAGYCAHGFSQREWRRGVRSRRAVLLGLSNPACLHIAIDAQS